MSLPAQAKETFVDTRLNILFIAIDDLNDMIPLLDPESKTQIPNLNKLASRSTVFTKAYATSTLCNPSRFSLLTGLRPSSTGVYLNTTDTLSIEHDYENIMTYLQGNGYKTVGIGKIFHGTQNQKSAWDEYFGFEKNSVAKKHSEKIWPRNWGVVNEELFDTRDVNTASKAVEYLEKKFDKPTFLAVGFHNPHLPWFYTEKESGLYPLSFIKIPEEPEYDLDDLPRIARTLAIQYNAANQSNYHEEVVAEGEWKAAIQAYLTGITYMDKELGRVIDALEEGPNAGNTLIVLWSDHGYHLGHKKHWNKHALWEKTSHVLLMFSLPPGGLLYEYKNKKEDFLEMKAQRSNKVVSLIDIFPTVLDLVGISKPHHLEGKSLFPLLKNPNRDWDHYAITTMDYKNHSLRKARWRYIRYRDGSEELYDHKFDPQEFYNIEDLESLEALKEGMEDLLPFRNVAPIKEI